MPRAKKVPSMLDIALMNVQVAGERWANLQDSPEREESRELLQHWAKQLVIFSTPANEVKNETVPSKPGK